MKGTIQEFVFEIVVDKKLVPKEVLETGDQKLYSYSTCTSSVTLPLNQVIWSLWSCLPGILWVLLHCSDLLSMINGMLPSPTIHFLANSIQLHSANIQHKYEIAMKLINYFSNLCHQRQLMQLQHFQCLFGRQQKKLLYTSKISNFILLIVQFKSPAGY